MTVPNEYQRAGEAFEAFLADARETLDFTTRNPTYTTVQGVLLAFRRRLTPEQVLLFADVLPAILRAIFTADWRPGEYVGRFGTRADWDTEVRNLRRNHNLSPDDSVSIIAGVLRRHVDEAALDHVLVHMPEGASEFWRSR